MQLNKTERIVQYKSGILSDVTILKLSSYKQASCLLYKMKDVFIWNVLTNFEGMVISLDDIETILNDFSTDNICINDMQKVRAYVDAVEHLAKDVFNNVFSGDKYDLIDLHRIIARSEIDAGNLGGFRRENVLLKNVSWKPLDYSMLASSWKQVEENIAAQGEILEKSLVVFLQLCRIQFFLDANKRTAILFANGLLMKNGFAPWLIAVNSKNDFYILLHDFYETGQADDLLQFLAKTSLIVQEDVVKRD